MRVHIHSDSTQTSTPTPRDVLASSKREGGQHHAWPWRWPALLSGFTEVSYYECQLHGNLGRILRYSEASGNVMIAPEVSGIARTNLVFCRARTENASALQFEADWKGYETLALALRADSLPEFLRDAVRLESEGKVDASIDAITFEIDRLMRAGQFEAIDDWFQRLPASRLSIQILLAILAASLPAKTRLPSRSGFFRRSRERVIELGDDCDVLEGLD